MEITDPSKDNFRRITFKKSFGNTNFYWLHFHTENIENLFKKKVYTLDFASTKKIMKELSDLGL